MQSGTFGKVVPATALEFSEVLKDVGTLSITELAECTSHLIREKPVDGARQTPSVFARLGVARQKYFLWITPLGKRFLGEYPAEPLSDQLACPTREALNASDTKAIDFIARETAVSALIAIAFDSLRTRAPGAAYLFARTLVNARPLIDDLTIPKTKKIKMVQDEIDESAKLNTGDASLGVNTSTVFPFLALKFVLRLLEVAERDVDASLGHSCAFGEIAKAGEHYRDLEPRDRQPPPDAGSQALLARQAHTCVGEVVDAVIADFEKMNYDRGRAAEDIAMLLAMYDLRGEAASGRLNAELQALEAAIMPPD
jgi:hypothetical protein